MRFFKFPRVRSGATQEEVCRAVNDISNHAEGFEREVMKDLSTVMSKINSLADEVSGVRETVDSLKNSQ